MAEVAAGVLAAEQIVSTGVQVGAAATISRPTQLSRVSLSQISGDAPALARSHHTLTVIGDSAYIFGGKGSDGQPSSNNVHEIPLPSKRNQEGNGYASHKASGVNIVGTGNPPLPAPRYGHAACARGDSLIIHGGQDSNGTLQDEAAHFWLWDTQRYIWTRMGPAQPGGDSPRPRHSHRIFYDDRHDLLIIHGGRTERDETESAETWVFDFTKADWTRLAFAPALPLGSVFDGGTLFSVSSDSDWVQSIHLSADFKSAEWDILETSSEGPMRVPGAVIVSLKLGLGRSYLLQLMGDGEKTSGGGDIWSLQLPSGALSGAAIKDVVRDALPRMDSGKLSWAEIETINPSDEEQPPVSRKKVHPGPRKSFGADDCGDGRRVIIWGGLSAKGEVESDGWILDFA